MSRLITLADIQNQQFLVMFFLWQYNHCQISVRIIFLNFLSTFKNQMQDVGLFCSQWKVRDKQSPYTTPPEQKARKVSFVTDLL